MFKEVRKIIIKKVFVARAVNMIVVWIVFFKIGIKVNQYKSQYTNGEN